MNNLIVASLVSMAGLSSIFAAILTIADKKLKVEEDPKITEIADILPSVNCAGCGYVGCHAFAEGIVKDHADPGRCHVVDEDALVELRKLSGIEGGTRYPKIPIVHCAAECEAKVPVADYKGVDTCSSAHLVFGAGMECSYGCMGFGDCCDVCTFDALHMVNGLPVLDQTKCTGCTDCVRACPRDLIEMVEKKHEKVFYVACNTHDGPQRVRKICGVGCIACTICEKMEPVEKYFTIEDNLSYADFSKQENQEVLRKIASKCPTKVIKEI